MILAWLRPFNNIHLQAAQIVSIYKLQWQWLMKYGKLIIRNTSIDCGICCGSVNVGLMLGQCRRRRANIKQTLVHCILRKNKNVLSLRAKR